jgi:hypothetical protein|nr:hypothetical protein [Kofleriaceae bacterium]
MRALLVMCALAACSKAADAPAAGSGTTPAADPVAGSSATAPTATGRPAAPAAPAAQQALLDAWTAAGMTPSAFAAATTDVGASCQAGTVAKLDVLICSYGSDADAKAAEDKGLSWVGDTTGVSRAKGSLLIVVADRHKADPNGRTINQLLHAE